MGLITEEVEIELGYRTYKHYENLGYTIPRRIDKWGNNTVPKGTKIIIKTNDLTNGSNVKIDVECDGCGEEIKNIIWQSYLKYVRDKKYYCQKCAVQLFGKEKMTNTKFKGSKPFEQWCIENNRKDILDRWDYELNKKKPNEITYKTHKKYYFKCSRGLHESELKNINTIVTHRYIECNQCNSFAQWGIDNLGEDFLEKYWDYEKNTVDPWEISKSINKPKVWIKCQEKDYHGSYDITCTSFVQGHRCSYCSNYNGKVNYLDSLGFLFPKVLRFWSNKNKKTPYEYTPFSSQYVYWKCPDGKHGDYYREVNSSNRYNFRCPECQSSKGEEEISNCLINKHFIKISQEEFDQLVDEDKYITNHYIPQMKYNGLIGLNGGLLSYDFYIPKLNLLIEYQGEQHERYVPGFHKSKKDFEKQVEHDRRKREYVKKNNIKLLEIWYYDFDNIEDILTRELNNLI